MAQLEGDSGGDSAGDAADTDMGGELSSSDMGGETAPISGESTDMGDSENSEEELSITGNEDQESEEQPTIDPEDASEPELESGEFEEEEDLGEEESLTPPVGSLERDRGMKLNDQIEGGVPEGYAGHHLIGINEAKSSISLQAATEAGYNINNGNNGIALPTDAIEAENTGLPLHNGRHSGEYTDRVAELLEQLDDRYIAAEQAGKPWNNGKLLDEIRETENTIRQELTQHQLGLQNTGQSKQI